MTIEQLVRDQLDRATQHVPGGPDLETRRPDRPPRRRAAGAAGVAVAAVAVLGLGAAGVP